MGGTTDTQSLRYGTVDDVISYLMQANLADDIATQLNAADTARTAGLHRPQVNITRNAALAIPVSTTTAVPYDTLNQDTHGMVNLGTQPTRVTCNASAGTGIYHVRFDASVDTTGWTKADLTVYKNGAFYDGRTFWGPQTFAPMEFETFVYLNLTTDFITTNIYHDGGGSTNTNQVFLYVQKIADG